MKITLDIRDDCIENLVVKALRESARSAKRDIKNVRHQDDVDSINAYCAAVKKVLEWWT